MQIGVVHGNGVIDVKQRIDALLDQDLDVSGCFLVVG